MKRDSVLSLVGIAKKADRVVSGEFQTETAIKSDRASLVMISLEASGNTRKKFQNMSSFYKIRAYLYGSREELGAASGTGFRAVLAVTDDGLANAIESKLIQAGAQRVDGNVSDTGNEEI
ncbi:MAG: ribosomal L7Ae/L30e/S12e/Gadd45 family protein [Lachnospiraceae bacterium]|nr:ribosomal L7Ae/L30e/S12e/Gadd45 family protein [Lachnospiraceae bacterium]MCD7840912.1 ribosomal L7Ae/L30e/S12e/Gadd45 family protein [Lachnospiraceae bacterium]